MVVIIHKCNRCTHEWPQRGAKTPHSCPLCKSPYWNSPRVRKVKVVACTRS